MTKKFFMTRDECREAQRRIVSGMVARFYEACFRNKDNIDCAAALDVIEDTKARIKSNCCPLAVAFLDTNARQILSDPADIAYVNADWRLLVPYNKPRRRRI